jgi:hypothetical protein
MNEELLPTLVAEIMMEERSYKPRLLRLNLEELEWTIYWDQYTLYESEYLSKSMNLQDTINYQ